MSPGRADIGTRHSRTRGGRPMRFVRWGLGAAALLATLGAASLYVPRAHGRPAIERTLQRQFRIEPNVPYDGRFTFARIRYTVYGRSGWEFDYPAMERHLMTMVRELTLLDAHMT